MKENDFATDFAAADTQPFYSFCLALLQSVGFFLASAVLQSVVHSSSVRNIEPAAFDHWNSELCKAGLGDYCHAANSNSFPTFCSWLAAHMTLREERSCCCEIFYVLPVFVVLL